jgi:fumarate reductase flavoprotein subunit
MSGKDKKSVGYINRRRFLKGVAATGSMGAIAAAYPSFAAQTAGENKAAIKSWRDKPDPINESLISDGGTYDVVVVGGGHAGLLCARVAAMKGASVAVIENQAEKGYLPGIDRGHVGTINSQYALDHGAPRIDEADFLREWARRSVIRHNPRRASYFVKNSGKVLDWLLSFADKESLAKNTHMVSCPPKPTVLLEVSGWKFYYGCAMLGTEVCQEVLKTHHRKAMADGAKWFFSHHAEICDIDGSGSVTGLIAKSSDGTYIRFKARKGIALCTGDFSGNREMVIDILDEVRHQAEAMGDLNLINVVGEGMQSPRDGSGIKMGVWAGGHVEIGPHSLMNEMGTQGDPGSGEWYLQLDHNGERFCDEAAGTTVPHQIGSFYVTLHDANWKKVLEMMPPSHTGPDNADTRMWQAKLTRLDNVKPGPLSQKKQENPQENRMGGGPPMSGGPMGGSENICCGRTIEELIDNLECYKGETKKKVLAEIERYNKMCEKGVDEDFGKDSRIMKVTGLKDPLFYGTLTTFNGLGRNGSKGISPGLIATTGLDTDAEGRVLNSEFKPIKGLYAAGNNAGGRFIVAYQTPFAGISVGMAITEGYMLGERLAAL